MIFLRFRSAINFLLGVVSTLLLRCISAAEDPPRRSPGAAARESYALRDIEIFLVSGRARRASSRALSLACVFLPPCLDEIIAG